MSPWGVVTGRAVVNGQPGPHVAAKYSASDAAIEVTVRQDGKQAEVVVRNHGTGVTPGDAETIFGKFFQGDPGPPGAGLGLYISRGLARAHDGDLHVQPAEQHGSEFILTLPAAPPDLAEPDREPHPVR